MSAHGVSPEAVAGPSPIAAEPAPEGFLIVSGHTSGWITPCGCPG